MTPTQFATKLAQPGEDGVGAPAAASGTSTPSAPATATSDATSGATPPAATNSAPTRVLGPFTRRSATPSQQADTTVTNLLRQNLQPPPVAQDPELASKPPTPPATPPPTAPTAQEWSAVHARNMAGLQRRQQQREQPQAQAPGAEPEGGAGLYDQPSAEPPQSAADEMKGTYQQFKDHLTSASENLRGGRSVEALRMVRMAQRISPNSPKARQYGDYIQSMILAGRKLESGGTGQPPGKPPEGLQPPPVGGPGYNEAWGNYTDKQEQSIDPAASPAGGTVMTPSNFHPITRQILEKLRGPTAHISDTLAITPERALTDPRLAPQSALAPTPENMATLDNAALAMPERIQAQIAREQADRAERQSLRKPTNRGEQVAEAGSRGSEPPPGSAQAVMEQKARGAVAGFAESGPGFARGHQLREQVAAGNVPTMRGKQDGVRPGRTARMPDDLRRFMASMPDKQKEFMGESPARQQEIVDEWMGMAADRKADLLTRTSTPATQSGRNPDPQMMTWMKQHPDKAKEYAAMSSQEQLDVMNQWDERRGA